MYKKYQDIGILCPLNYRKKALNIMRLTVLLFFAGIFSVSATVYSQEARVTIHAENKRVSEIITEIKTQTNYSFWFDVKDVNVNRKISIHAQDKTLEDVLHQMFKGENVDFKLKENHIILTKKGSPVSLNKFQQSKKITGVVKDKQGSPVIGANIVLKGTTVGTITDAEGRFSLETDNHTALVVSYIGFLTQEVNIANKTDFNIILSENMTDLEEIVVVGYGVQKKINLSGSVSSISTKSIDKSMVPNTANLLQGKLAGLEVLQSSAKPGQDDPAIRIRGMGSYGASSAPLVLVDGIIGSLTAVAPNDIESVTVLKDAASASIYGARAANGVILLTTKKGNSNTPSIEYKFNIGFQNPTKTLDLIWDSAEYMEMYNSARLRSGLSPIYTQEQIDQYKNATDRMQYPNFNWPEYIFKTATVQNHAISLAKSSESSKFRLGLNYSKQDGIVPEFDSQKFNLNLNYENQIHKIVKVGTTTNFFYKKSTEPQSAWEIFLVRGIYSHSPLTMPYLPDGSGRKSSGRIYESEPFSTFAPLAFSNGNAQKDTYSAQVQAFVVVDILKDLQWETRGAFNFDYFYQKAHSYSTPNEFYFYQKKAGMNDYMVDGSVGSPSIVGVSDLSTQSLLPTVFSTLKYNTQVKEHDISAMIGYEQQSNNWRYLSGGRTIFPSPDLKELDAGSPDGQTLNGSSNDWALQSFFGRVGYNYDRKYFFEGNIRYDGTSRVASAHRWGVFPSGSVAWNISEEGFLKDRTQNWLNNLKLRASYGVLGNQEIGLYPYQDIFGYANYSYGGSVDQGVLLSKMTDKNLKWESTRVIDIGLDLEIFNGLFGLNFDWYKKNTYDVLTTLPVPSSLGLIGPTTNDGELQNKGFEMEVKHRNNIGEFYYDANFQLSLNRNKLVSIVAPTKGVNEVGLPYASLYLYEWIGIFQSQEDIDKSPIQIITPKPGDLKFKDQNGDGLVNEEDRKSFCRFPDFFYSFGFNASWKRFNLSAFFQGVSGSHVYLSDWTVYPFREGIPPKTEFGDAWTPENPSNTVPAVHEYSYSPIYGYPSTYLFRNSSYLRLKNLYFSYSLPEKILNPFRCKGLTVYFSGDNLLTFTNYTDGDPDRTEGASLSAYPQVRVLNFGFNINF